LSNALEFGNENSESSARSSVSHISPNYVKSTIRIVDVQH